MFPKCCKDFESFRVKKAPSWLKRNKISYN